MTAFRTLDELRASLEKAGLGRRGAPLLGSARPTILFLRVQERDDDLPSGISKIGGFPDLPKGFAWPMRPPYPDAAERAAAEKKSIRDVAALWSSPEFRDLLPGGISQERQDAHLSAAEERGRALAETFPLGFVGQFDLAALSAEPGFDPALPRTGLLSVFEDVAAEGLPGAQTCWWFSEPPDKLLRTAPPERFARHFDLCGPDGVQAAESWTTMTFTETLVPYSGVSVPYHWRSLIPSSSVDWERLNDWWYSDADKLAPTPPSFEGHGPNPPQAGFFDDRLGGWPDPMQDDPENHVDHRRILAVGDAPFRHIFTTGGDFLSGARRMRSSGKGDGRSYHLIAPEDLAARRFEAVRCVAQSD